MENQPQNHEFRISPENFHPFGKTAIINTVLNKRTSPIAKFNVFKRKNTQFR